MASGLRHLSVSVTRHGRYCQLRNADQALVWRNDRPRSLAMPLPVEIARQLTEQQIAFVQRSGLKAEVLEPGFVALCRPLAGNQNPIVRLYAGALFTPAEIPGGALFLSCFDARRFYPVVKDVNLRVRRPATGEIRVEARLESTEIVRLEQQASSQGKL